jgi:type II secretory pathway predicted ATPase ExeA/TPR repeat protein
MPDRSSLPRFRPIRAKTRAPGNNGEDGRPGSAFAFLGLQRDPFGDEPDHEFLYTNPSTREIYGRLIEAAVEKPGIVLLSGEAGVGKTILLQRLSRELRAAGLLVLSRYRAGLVFEDLVAAISDELGIHAVGDGTAQWRPRLHDAGAPIGRQVPILVIDQAEQLGGDVVGQLDTLLAPGGTERALFRIVLCGRSDLVARIALPVFSGISKRLALHCRLSPLDDDDAATYIFHRLRCGGCRDAGLFAPAAINMIVAAASGLPRNINRLCRRCLVLACSARKPAITSDIVEDALRGLRPSFAGEPEPAHRAWPRRLGPTMLGASLAVSVIAAVAVDYPSRGGDEDKIAAPVPIPEPRGAIDAATATAAGRGGVAGSALGPQALVTFTMAPGGRDTDRVELMAAGGPDAPWQETGGQTPAFDAPAMPAEAVAPPASAESAAPRLASAPMPDDRSGSQAPDADQSSGDSVEPPISGDTGAAAFASPPASVEPAAAPLIPPAPVPIDRNASQLPTPDASRNDADQPSGADETVAAARGAPPASAKGTPDDSAMADQPDAAVEDGAASLALRAERQLAAGHLSEPAGDNALRTYREILAIAPNGPAAARLLAALRDRLEGTARDALAAGSWKEAQRFYELALHPDVEPRSADVAVPNSAAPPIAPPPPEITITSPTATSPGEPGARAERSAASAPSGRGAAPDGRAARAEAGSSLPQAAGAPPAASEGRTEPLPPAASRLSADTISALLKRGNELLAIGDISAARLMFERAASGGSARAMTGLGKTQDPAFLNEAGARGIRADPAIAAEWYGKAAALGDAEGASLMKRLEALTRK